MTYTTLYDAINTLVLAALDRYQPARSNFGFDLQPAQESDRVYRLTMVRDRTEGYLGRGQAELYRAEVWITRRINRSAQEAEAFLRADLITLEDRVLTDSGIAAYNVADDSVTVDVQSPAMDAEYIVGRLTMVLDVERFAG